MKRILTAMLLLGLAACGQGGTRLTVSDPQYRPPLGASGVGVAYFSVTSDRADKITRVSSPQANRVEIHTTVIEGTQASMKRVATVELSAGRPVIFGSGGMHLMVFDPWPLAEGATFPIQIELESGRSETFAFPHALSGAGDRR